MTEQKPELNILSNQKIRGWLILPALGVALSPFVLGINMLNDLAAIAQFSFADPKKFGLAVYVMVYYIILMPLATTTFYKFFWKKKTGPLFYIAMSSANVLFSIINFTLSALAPELMTAKTLSLMANLAQVLGPILGASIWIPYFIFSKRVKITFIND